MVTSTARDGWIPLGDAIFATRTVATPAASSPSLSSSRPPASSTDHADSWPAASHDHLHVAVSPSGSFLATCRDASKPYIVANVSSASALDVPLVIYRASGTPLRIVPCDRQVASFIAIGFTNDERLACVLDDGTVLLHPVHGDPTYLSLGENARRDGIVSAQIWPHGMAALTRAGLFIVLDAWSGDEMVPTEYAHSQLASTPIFWTAIPSAVSMSGSIEMIAALADTTMQITSNDAIKLYIPAAKSIRSSPSGKYWAVVTAGHHLQIWLAGSSHHVPARLDLTDIIDDVGAHEVALAWCGDETVLAIAGDEAMVILHISGEHSSLDLLDSMRITESIDACYAVTPTAVTLYSIVDASLRDAFNYASTHPSAQLLEAAAHQASRSPHAIDVLESLVSDRSALQLAIATLQRAAEHAWDPKAMRACLDAVQLARAWLATGAAASATGVVGDGGDQDPDALEAQVRAVTRATVRAARRARVATALRAAGYPITHAWLVTRRGAWVGGTDAGRTTDDELEDDGTDDDDDDAVPLAITSLLAARDHALAVRAAEILASPAASRAAVMDWARLRLTEGRRFDAPGVPPLAAEHAVVQQVAMRIRDLGKGGARPGDFADLALAASRAGNVDAAAMVLEYEADAARTVRMLLEWNRGELALARAVANMERDLVYMVLIYLEKRLRLSDLLETVRACPEAWPYLERYARDNDRGLLRRIYHQENRDVESGNLLLEDAAKASTIHERQMLLRDAQIAFSQSKRATAEQTLVKHALALAKLHKDVMEKYPPLSSSSNASLASPTPNPDLAFNWLSMSTRDTIVQLVRQGRIDDASAVRGKLGVTDKRWAWCVIQGLVASRDWEALDRFASGSAKPACGYRAVVKMCMDAGANEQAAKYIRKCDIKMRIDLFVQAGDLMEAAKVAAQLGDMDALNRLQASTPDQTLRAAIVRLMEAVRRR